MTILNKSSIQKLINHTPLRLPKPIWGISIGPTISKAFSLICSPLRSAKRGLFRALLIFTRLKYLMVAIPGRRWSQTERWPYKESDLRKLCFEAQPKGKQNNTTKSSIWPVASSSWSSILSRHLMGHLPFLLHQLESENKKIVIFKQHKASPLCSLFGSTNYVVSTCKMWRSKLRFLVTIIARFISKAVSWIRLYEVWYMNDIWSMTYNLLSWY